MVLKCVLIIEARVIIIINRVYVMSTTITYIYSEAARVVYTHHCADSAGLSLYYLEYMVLRTIEGIISWHQLEKHYYSLKDPSPPYVYVQALPIIGYSSKNKTKNQLADAMVASGISIQLPRNSSWIFFANHSLNSLLIGF